jgi:hypothetical protein
MKTNVGLWVDHRNAIVMTVTDKGDATEQVISSVEKHLSRSGDSPLDGRYESYKVPADDHRQRTFTEHLKIYYDAIIACIGKAESVMIFGPGEAKGELRKRLTRKNFAGRILRFETVNRMTDRQIAAKIREHFAA